MDDWSMAIQSAQMAIDTAMTAAQMGFQSYQTDKQNAYNLEMWNKQNEYNSPQAQMQRFAEAGLNPNLIYSQGSSGNNAQAAQKNAPDYSPALTRLQKAFNIVNLMHGIQDVRKAQADADIAAVNAEREFDHYEADKAMGQQYEFDMKTGRYVPVEAYQDENGEWVVPPSYAYPGQHYYKMQHLAENYQKNALIVPREAYLNAQRLFLAPQTRMKEYEAKNFSKTFWIDRGRTPLGVAAGLWHYLNELRRSGRSSLLNF